MIQENIARQSIPRKYTKLEEMIAAAKQDLDAVYPVSDDAAVSYRRETLAELDGYLAQLMTGEISSEDEKSLEALSQRLSQLVTDSDASDSEDDDRKIILPEQQVEEGGGNIIGFTDEGTIAITGVSESMVQGNVALTNIVIDTQAQIRRDAPVSIVTADTLKSWHIPPQRHVFTGQVKTLQGLNTAAQTGTSIVLQGAAGTGKTQIALAYLHHHHQAARCRLWFPAVTPAQLLGSYILFVYQLGQLKHPAIEIIGAKASYVGGSVTIDGITVNITIAGRTATVSSIQAVVKKWFADNPGYVVVYDNALDYTSVKDYLPDDQGGQVLVTSQSSAWPAAFHGLSMGKMEEAEALELLQTLTRGKDDTVLKALANELGYLPLRLAQAGAFMQRYRYAPDVYLALYQKDPQKYLKQRLLPKGADYQPLALSQRSNLESEEKEAKHVPMAVEEKEARHNTWGIPAQPRIFVGRKQLLGELDRQFSEGDQKHSEQSTSKLVLTTYGLGGIGKTQLALQYIRHHSHHTFKAWFPAGTEAQLLTSYEQFARRLAMYKYPGITVMAAQDSQVGGFTEVRGMRLYINGEKATPQLIQKAVKDWFAQHPGWLAVYDNAADYDSIKDYLPEEGGQTLITSRRQDWPQTFEKLPVNVMSEEDAVELLEKLTGVTNDPTFKILAEKLGHLPLALAQAGAYIQVHGILPTEYLTLYEENQQKYLATKLLPDGIDYAEPVALTWRISMQKIAEEAPKYEESLLVPEVLEVCAYLASNNIPCALLERWLQYAHPDESIQHRLREIMVQLHEHLMIEWEEGEIVDSLEQEILRELQPHIEQTARQTLREINAQSSEHSMIEWGKGTVSVHTLVQEVTRYRHQHASQQLRAEEMANWWKLLIDSMSDAFAQDVDLREENQWQQDLLPHLQSLLYHAQQNAIEPIEQALLMSHIGHVFLGVIGNAHQGKNYYERTLTIDEAHYGQDHVKVAITLMNLGNAYGDLGDYEKKKALLERALQIQESHYGQDHVEVGQTLMNLGNAYRGLGDYEKQKALLERALIIFEAHYGKDHVSVASTLTNLGTAYGSFGDYEKQKALLERALIIDEAHYGKDHVEVARTLGNLSNAYGSFGDYGKQKALLERVLIIDEAHYGQDHVEVAKTLTNLGTAYGSFGDYEKQKALLERALIIFEAHYGQDHVAVAKTLGSLGNAYNSLGQPKQAKEVLLRALTIEEAHYGQDHVGVVEELMSLGVAYGFLGDYGQAKALFERIFPILEKHYGPKHVKVARILGNLSNAYGSLGDYEQAKVLLEHTLPILEEHYGPKHVEVARILGNLSSAYGSLGDHEQAKVLLERTLPIIEEHYGPKHVEVAKVLGNLGIIYGDLGDYEQAKALLERDLKIVEEHYNPEHVQVAKTLFNLARAYIDLGEQRQAYHYVQRMYPIVLKTYGASHPHSKQAQELLSRCKASTPYTLFFKSPSSTVEDQKREEKVRLLDLEEQPESSRENCCSCCYVM